MSLISALNIGKTALAVHQAAIQVTSNNVANAGNPNYTRQVARSAPLPETQLGPGLLVGNGVTLTAIERQIDEALEGRLRDSISDSESASVRQDWMSRVETVFNELGDTGLSSRFSAFFSAWSNLANKPQDISLRQIVVQEGQSVASYLHDLRSQLVDVQLDTDKRLEGLAKDANSLCDQIASINEQISSAEGGTGGTANSLRDQRDELLKKLSGLIDIKVQDIGNGLVNVLVGSETIVMGSVSRGITLRNDNGGGVFLATADDGTKLPVTSGQIGGILSTRGQIDDVIGRIDNLAGNLIFEVNKIHASGQGLEGFSQVSAGNAVNDVNAALNTAGANLSFTPNNGSFVVHVKNKATGLTTSTLVQVNLDGLGGDDTSLQSLRASLDDIDGISATITAGKLRISADSGGMEFSFSQDTSGALAALGINSFFTGTDAGSIAINADLKARPSLLAASANGQAGDNQSALAIAALDRAAIAGLNGLSLSDSYNAIINGVATSTAAAKNSLEAAQAVQDTLSTQREALSGVSLDEEAINLLREQRAFQGAARVISAVDELMKTLLSMT